MILVLDQAGYTYEMAGKARTHERWLEVMRFGLDAILDQPDLITELVYEEATAMAKMSGLKPYQEVAAIFEELSITIARRDNG